MKRVKLKFPLSRAEAFADFCHTNGIPFGLTWVTDEFFSSEMFTITYVSDEQAEQLLKSDFSRNIIK
jgi:hypothetical protein